MEKLYEMIDGSQAVEFTKISQWKYYFELEEENLEYFVEFDQDDDTVEVAFKMDLGENGHTHDHINIGFGAAMKVFHTVWLIIRDFLDTSEDPISVVEFAAKNSDKSRVKFYRTLATQLARAYGYDSSDVEESLPGPNRYFTIPVERVA